MSNNFTSNTCVCRLDNSSIWVEKKELIEHCILVVVDQNVSEERPFGDSHESIGERSQSVAFASLLPSLQQRVPVLIQVFVFGVRGHVVAADVDRIARQHVAFVLDATLEVVVYQYIEI